MIYPTVQRVIDVLLKVAPEDFRMQSLTNCIAGHCKKLGLDENMSCEEVFTAMTGINNRKISRHVVYPDDDPATFCGMEATVAQAINMLEYLRDTGIVDWNRVMETDRVI